ncbi:MAG: hypothetical protein M0R31_03845 [Candidatus Riflebacteria bacterium]|nr:hypothetical protein [Candidatus Riflebacteria bacterium]
MNRQLLKSQYKKDTGKDAPDLYDFITSLQAGGTFAEDDPLLTSCLEYMDWIQELAEKAVALEQIAFSMQQQAIRDQKNRNK